MLTHNAAPPAADDPRSWQEEPAPQTPPVPGHVPTAQEAELLARHRAAALADSKLGLAASAELHCGWSSSDHWGYLRALEGLADAAELLGDDAVKAAYDRELERELAGRPAGRAAELRRFAAYVPAAEARRLLDNAFRGAEPARAPTGRAHTPPDSGW
jgi:hypothetical protein